jgi:hypothetical protein
MRSVAGLCAAAAFGVIVAVNAQTKSTTRQSPAVDPDIVTVSGCVTKGADGVFMLTNARRESGATGAAATSATWTIDVPPLAAGVLDMNDRVGQRIEAIGRIVTTISSTAASSKTTGKAAYPQLQIQSVKPLETTGCS